LEPTVFCLDVFVFWAMEFVPERIRNNEKNMVIKRFNLFISCFVPLG